MRVVHMVVTPEEAATITIQDTLITIRKMGLTASWSPVYKEFRVNLRDGDEASAYFTNDRLDAIRTAEHMAVWDLERKSLRKETGVEYKERQ